MRVGRWPITVSIADGGAVESLGGHDLSLWRLRALLSGAALATIATLALTTLPAPPAPSSHPPMARYRPQSGLSATSLPINLAPVASASIGASERSFWPARRGAGLQTKGGGIESSFTPSGARLRTAQETLGLSLTAFGHGQHIVRVASVDPTAEASQVLYRRGAISEFYRNGPYGLEQGFTLRQRPSGSGSLVLAIRVDGSLTPARVGSQVLFRGRAGAIALRYGQLTALDASGRRLPAHMQIRNGNLQLKIDDSHAHYPLRIDPFIQQGEKLAGGGEVGNGQFGGSVALSDDGNTVLIGGPADNKGVGAAWVFTRSGSTWTQQGSKLIGGGESGKGGFGFAVALSSDGNTALIGGLDDKASVGAAWVFTRSGSTWTQQGGKLTGGSEVGNGQFGASVALSAEGSTALIGGPSDSEQVGAAWVFTRSGSTWTQQGGKLTGGGESGKGYFGFRVALSADGNTALIGGGLNSARVTNAGAAWVFTRSGSTWTQQGAKLKGAGEVGEGEFGVGVALSSDGNTALIGGFNDNEGVGAAWVFTRSGTTWTQQGSKLTGGGEVGKGLFGVSVALPSDGNTALIGGPGDNEGVGAAWVFTRSGTTWTQQGSKLTGAGEVGAGELGESVALSRDGNTALIGGFKDNEGVGAAWVFVAPPAITKVSPTKGPVSGGTSVTITGTNLSGATAVKFGTTDATSFTVKSASTITATSPAEGAGTVDVTVTTPAGTSAVTLKDHFKFVPTVTGVSPNTGSTAGGTSVAISGTGFALGKTATVFKFGKAKATSVNCTTSTSCTAVSPAHEAGTVDVKATVNKASSVKNALDRFTYA
jgi:IPT/TIG domain